MLFPVAVVAAAVWASLLVGGIAGEEGAVVVVSNVSGCPLSPAGLSGVLCRATQAPLTLTITGSGFGLSGAVVYVGRHLCGNVTHFNDSEDQELSCTLGMPSREEIAVTPSTTTGTELLLSFPVVVYNASSGVHSDVDSA
eukprot:RCo010194